MMQHRMGRAELERLHEQYQAVISQYRIYDKQDIEDCRKAVEQDKLVMARLLKLDEKETQNDRRAADNIFSETGNEPPVLA
jgi:SepF-like predicted cell division protein (DUF552 family)